MTFQAKDVMSAASITLQDVGAVRWTLPELLGYLNDGVREIVTIKPNAASITIDITLEAGPKQTLPEEYTVLSRAIRNTVSGKPIRALNSREMLDTQIPGWMNAAVLNFALDVSYVVHDMTDPRTFYVAPGALVTSSIECVVGVMPAPIALPASPELLASYSAPVGLPDLYRNGLNDYVTYRAFAKDSGIAGNAMRAQAHKALFDSALVNIANGENGMSLANFARSPAGA